MVHVYLNGDVQYPQGLIQSRFLSSSFSLAEHFLHLLPNFPCLCSAGMEVWFGGTCHTGLGLVLQISDTLANSVFLLTLKAHFYHARIIIFLFLQLYTFLLNLEVITSEQGRLYPTWTPDALSGAGEARAVSLAPAQPCKCLASGRERERTNKN